MPRLLLPSFSFFFFNDTATTEIYTLSLHDALPTSRRQQQELRPRLRAQRHGPVLPPTRPRQGDAALPCAAGEAGLDPVEVRAGEEAGGAHGGLSYRRRLRARHARERGGKRRGGEHAEQQRRITRW